MVGRSSERVGDGARAGHGPARAGWYDSTASGPPAGPPSPPAAGRTRRRDVARVSADPTPGRSLVTRRAIRDLVRTATLGYVRRHGFAGGGPLGRLLERLGIAHPGSGSTSARR